MLKWLPSDEPCQVPGYAHTMVGAGAMVINEKKEILVVQEKYYQRPHWKLPGGYVDPGNFNFCQKRLWLLRRYTVTDLQVRV